MSQPTGTQSGAAGGDPNAQSGAGDPQTGQPNTDPNTGSGTQSGAEPVVPAQTDMVTRAELETVMARMRAADQRASKAEAAVTAAERAKLDENERTKAELADAQKALEEARAAARQQSLELAFLKDNTYKWRDPEAALKLADLSGVEYGDDGSVTGLGAALKKLADTKKYLIEEPEANNDPPATRRTVIGNSGGNPNPPDRNAMESKFPALRGRVKSA